MGGENVGASVIAAIPVLMRETGEGLRLDFGDLPPGTLQGTLEPHEMIEMAGEVLAAPEVW